MTSQAHRSGTDRAAEAAGATAADVIVNIQGDEPMIDPLMIAEVVRPFREGTQAGIVTLKKEVFHDAEFADPGVVKVVTDPAGWALYFSRSLIPYPRVRTDQFHVYEHVGLYAYTDECLLRLAGSAGFDARGNRGPGAIARFGERYPHSRREDRLPYGGGLRRHS